VAIGRKDPKSCKVFIADNAEQNYCIGYVALSMSDPLICNEIDTEEDKDNCYFNTKELLK
jgi:predicted RNA-binding protein with PIN domain